MDKLNIEWEIGEQFDDAGDGYVFFHTLRGTSEDGKKWTASGQVMFGDIIEIEDIEEE
jgi:hypothetical protein